MRLITLATLSLLLLCAASQLATADAKSTSQQENAKVNVTGAWLFQVETPNGTGSPTFNFKQEGEKLTGQYKGAFGERESFCHGPWFAPTFSRYRHDVVLALQPAGGSIGACVVDDDYFDGNPCAAAGSDTLGQRPQPVPARYDHRYVRVHSCPAVSASKVYLDSGHILWGENDIVLPPVSW